jgi:hypothetical protein
MSLYDLVLLIIILCIGGVFWRFRATSEAAKVYLDQYCNNASLQLLSVARSQTKIHSFHGKLDFLSIFNFEFSGNGEDSYQGKLIMTGLKVMDIELPAYKLN